MNIAFIGMYYFPESFSSRYLISDIVNRLRNEGHKVTVVVPNPVRGLSPSEIQYYKNTRENGVERLWCGTNSGNGLLGRLKRIFQFQNKLKKYLKTKAFDCFIVQSNPPIFIPLMIEKIARKKRSKVIYYVDDIFPDIINKKGLINVFLKKIAKKSYVQANSIVTVSEDIVDTLHRKGVNTDNVHVIKPWPFETDGQAQKEILKKGLFNVAYIGNVGQFQNCDIILDSAKLVNNDKMCFYIVGSGRKETHIKNRINKERINNVIYVDRLPEIEARELYSRCDLNIISLGRNVIFNAMPSKTSSCVLSGKPCLLLCDESKYSSEMTSKYSFYLNSSFNPASIANQLESIYNSDNTRFVSNIKCIDDFSKEKGLLIWADIVKSLEKEV